MKKRLLFWVPILAIAVAGAAFALPASPFYLPDFLVRGGYHDGHSTRYWVKALNDPDAAARARAAHSLGAIGPEAEVAVPELARVLRQDPDPGPRVEAAMALTKMRPASRAAVPALTEALADEDRQVRMNVVIALSGLGEAARPAIPALIRAMQDETNQTNVGHFSFTIREEAAIALGRASAGTAEAVPALTEALRTASTVPMREATARALGTVGAEARPAVPLLQALLKDKDSAQPWIVEQALNRIEGKPEGEARATP
ncbi:MAG TPA: HEAT repeat domain-containing protein [Gemmataceae bacterium]|jgi:HEAT repeat protein|nr:HEAT repeat domain-containing protein [Gemmataceae bacterium]